MKNPKKKPFAVFTMAHNEKVFLPIWLKYYSQFFAPEDIYVIDHDTTDGSIEQAKKIYKFNVGKVHHGTVHDNKFMITNIRNMQQKLLQQYEIVVYTDTDEIILPDPISYKGLGDYINKFNHSVVACNSRSVVQQPTEPPIDLSKPILTQRSVWFSEYLYNKSLISKIPLAWDIGLHGVLHGVSNNINIYYDIPVDRELILLHLSRMDFNIRKQRGESIAKEKWGAESGVADQWQLKGHELIKWFYNPPFIPIAPPPKFKLDYSTYTDDHLNSLIEYIPARFKNII